jgi:NAD(P)-dependent dehydrogenase (short-subunit alcohol dehydrogenase family)
MTQNMPQQPLVLVLGGTGKVGRRIAARLTDRGVPVRIGARTAAPAFDWNDPAWQANPTLAYQNLTAAQKSQLNQSPGLPSPPPASTVAANIISQMGTTGDQTQSVGQQAGQQTGALLGRRRLLPVHYRGVGRHG